VLKSALKNNIVGAVDEAFVVLFALASVGCHAVDRVLVNVVGIGRG